MDTVLHVHLGLAVIAAGVELHQAGIPVVTRP